VPRDRYLLYFLVKSSMSTHRNERPISDVPEADRVEHIATQLLGPRGNRITDVQPSTEVIATYNSEEEEGEKKK